MSTYLHKFENILRIATAVTDNSCDLPNTSIFVNPISIFVPGTTIELKLANKHRINAT